MGFVGDWNRVMNPLIRASILAFAITGCGVKILEPPHTKTHKVSSGLQLGHVKLSVSNPIPWQQVAEGYKPKFVITSAGKLLDEVTPRVAEDYYSHSQRQSVQAEFGYQGAQLANTFTSTDKTEIEQGEITSSTGETEEIKNVTKTTPKSPEINPSAPETSLTFKPRALADYDPTTKYRAATALFQRIKTLNNYLDASYNTATHAAFLMHVQLTAAAYAKNQPYGLFSTLTLSKTKEFEKSLQSGQGRMDEGSYKIFPLLIADNPERVASERRSQLANEMLLKLVASGGQVSGGAGIERVIEELNVLSGDEINNLLTLSQSSERDLTVMIGAGYDPDSRYAIRDKTIDLSFVVSIPRAAVNDGTEYQIRVDNQFRHVLTGKMLPPLVEADIKNFAKRYLRESSSRCNKMKLKEATKEVKKYLYGESDFSCWIRDRSLYLELLNARRQLAIRGHKVTFGPLDDDPPRVQTVVFTDNKETLEVRLADKPTTDTSFLSALLLVNPKKPVPLTSTDLSGKKISSIADAVFSNHSVSQTGRVTNITFPSLAALGLDLKTLHLSLALSLKDDSSGARTYPMVYMPPKAKKPPRKASFSLAKITALFDGNAKQKLNALVILKPNKKLAKDIVRLRLSVVGGVLDDVIGLDKAKKPVALTAGALDVASNSYSFKPGKESAYRVILEQLGPQSSPIVVHVTGLDSAGKVIKAESGSIVFK